MAILVGVASHLEYVSADEPPSFFHDRVLPILKARCYSCHSHGSGEMQGGLALDWRSGWETGGSRGPSIVAGDPKASLLVRAIRHEEPDLHMPEEKLPVGEIEILTQWIERGAFDDRVIKPLDSHASDTDWWSLRPLEPRSPPLDCRNPIDAFVHHKLLQQGLEPSAQADRRTLIRRVTYDLVGLPPSFEEMEAFVSNPDEQAYEKLVDRLLASERYGERWARHWFDTIHFADSHGYEHDVGRDNAWHYRDYMIDALNQDKSWSRLIREQLAADYFFPEESHLIPALGFLGAGTFDLSTYSTAPVTFDYLDRDDVVTQTLAAFSSTTANCARCHAHKFDPISQEDYYALQAVFSGVIKGDVAFDKEPKIAALRASLERCLDAAERRDMAVILQPEHHQKIQDWQALQKGASQWEPLQLRSFVSLEGSTLALNDSQILVASGKNPERDTYVINAKCSLDKITAVRLDLHPHETLPMGGPGRCHNGNLHISEVELQCFDPDSRQGRTLKIRRATADFNQAGWGIERAIDGDAQTAWGIHPEEGKPHYAVFELSEPLPMTSETILCIVIKQLHGGSHLVGAMSLSATSEEATRIQAIPLDVERVLAKTETDRSDENRVTLGAFAIKQWALEELAKLPAKSQVYAAGKSVAIPTGNGQIQTKTVDAPKFVHVLHRGDFDKPRQVIGPGALSVFPNLPHRFEGLSDSLESQRRGALAEWLVHRDNVLTWRSIVNRVWHHHFGRGICDTPSDLGRMGGMPTHPELIDWMAVWFRDEAHGSLKALHRLIVTSDTYCQVSTSRADGRESDSENRWLWRQNRQRLDADAIRDYVLAASGDLDLQMGGPGVQHFSQSKGPQSTPNLDYTAFDWSAPGAHRRSIYRYVWRGIADPFMEAVDFPDLGLLSPVRGFSASALQALTLFNNDFILACSQQMADKAAEGHRAPQEQVKDCVRRIWLREPTPEEVVELTNFAAKHSLAKLCRVLFNSNEFLFVD